MSTRHRGEADGFRSLIFQHKDTENAENGTNG